MTDDSAFKKQVRARMAETGEKYTVARRMVIADQEPDQPPVVLRVHLNHHVDLALTAAAVKAYTAADEPGRQAMAAELLAQQIETAGSAADLVAAPPEITTGQALRTEAEAAQHAAISDAVQRSIAQAVGLSAVEINLTPDRVHVIIRAARPDAVWGFHRAAATEGVWRESAADQLRRELENLTGKRVRLDIQQLPAPQETPASAAPA